MGTTAVSTRRLSVRQSNGRIANAVAELLRRKLTIPEIYLRPRVPGLSGVDVLAVNHAGSGDIHGVEIAFGREPLKASDVVALLVRLKSLPLHFKYLAAPASVARMAAVQTAFGGVRGFDPQGIGRVGLISYSDALLESDGVAVTEDEAALLVRPERFLLRGEKLAAMERFLAKGKPDIRVRI
jgi:hypothetical protein